LGFTVRAGGGMLDHQAETKSEKHTDHRGSNERNRNRIDNGAEGQPDEVAAASPRWKQQRR
jgi:hypothetical protein